MFKLLITKDQRISQINGYYRRIGVSVESFQVSCVIFETASLIFKVGNDRYQRC